MKAKFKVGDKAKVVGNESSHGFKIGELVNVIDFDPSYITRQYFCTSDVKGCFFMSNEDLEPIEQMDYKQEYERLRQLYEPSGFKAGELVAFSHSADFISAVVTNYQSFDDEMHYCCDNYSYRYAMSWSQFVELKNGKA